MPLILIDARGLVVGLADDPTAGPPWVQGLQRGASLLRHLQSLDQPGSGNDIEALQLGLAAVLGGRQRHFEHRHAHAGWRVQVRACADAGEVAAVVSFDNRGDEPLRAQLTAAERRLAAVQMVAGLGSWYVDMPSGRVQWSPEIYQVLGVDPTAGPLNSATVRSRVHPEDLPRLRADRTRVYAGEPLVTSHFRFRRDDGGERWLESRVTLEPATADQPAGIVGTVRDVSENTRAQLALLHNRDQLEDLVVSRTVQLAAASERAEAVGRMKAAVLAHTSHEIRTPLNVIVSLSHLMRCSLTDAAQQGRAQAVEHAARHLSAIIDDVLAVAHSDPASPVPIAGAEAGEPIPGVDPAVHAEPAGPSDAATRIRLRHRGRRVLLAEDDDINQMAMQELLADVGLDVDVANDGHEAVDQASRRAYALILLDLRMPRLDGVGAARTIRALPDHHATPMVAITANAFDEDRQACRAAGMNDFMAKPVEVRRLYEVLLHWLDRGSAGTATVERAAAAGPAAAALLPPAASPAPAPVRPPVPAAAAVPPGGDPMRSLLGLEGVDALGGLASVGGKPAVYWRLLQVFIETHADDGAQLQRLLQARDTAAAGSLAHRVRGSAATLGLIDIEVAAAALEGAIDDPVPDAPLGLLAQAVGQALQATLQRLREALAG